MIGDDAPRTIRTLDDRLDRVNGTTLPQSAGNGGQGTRKVLPLQSQQPKCAAPLFFAKFRPSTPKPRRFLIEESQEATLIQRIARHGQVFQDLAAKAFGRQAGPLGANGRRRMEVDRRRKNLSWRDVCVHGIIVGSSFFVLHQDLPATLRWPSTTRQISSLVRLANSASLSQPNTLKKSRRLD